jgi:DtxR family Mn-dependent transcriptional regulator
MSESEDMYLLTVARLVEAGEDAPIPVSRLAQELSIQPISANQMIRKLEEAGWVRYTPYKGVVLTQEGEKLALRTLRHRRLWEVFLVEALKLTLEEADEMACRLEHILPAEVAERLAEFLGHPVTSPRGKPIPELDTAINLPDDMALSQIEAGQHGRITQVCADKAGQTFLSGEGIKTGAEITMLGTGHEGAVLVDVGGCSVYLAKGLADQIRVRLDTHE